LEFFVSKNHKSEKEKNQCVFEKPVGCICVADVGIDPTEEEENDENFEPGIVF
jgi:hypothetical protein